MIIVENIAVSAFFSTLDIRWKGLHIKIAYKISNINAITFTNTGYFCINKLLKLFNTNRKTPL
jgi:hypothetical protein